MAPKRSSLLEDPPAASSSEDELESEEEEEEEEVEEEPVVEEGAGDDEESESDDVEEETPKKPNPPSAPKTQAPSSSDSENDDEEGDESDSDDSPKKPLDLYRTSTHIVKPSQPKKTVSKPTPSAATTSAAPKTQAPATGKRPLEADKAEKEKEKEKESKRKKKKVEGEDEDDSVPDEGEKDHKNPFQRLWSDDDELVILKFMRDCIKKGIDPTSDLDEFLDSIKKSIHVNFNKDQLANKIRRLKQKYRNCIKRAKGEDPTFSKPHDIKCFELMKEIWAGSEGKTKKGGEANNGNDDSIVTNGKRNRKATSKSGAAASPKPKTVALADIPNKESPKFEEKNLSSYPCLNGSVQSSRNSAVMGNSLYKEGLALLADAKVKELEQKWRKLETAELEIHLKRVDLVREQTSAVLDALKSSDS